MPRAITSATSLDNLKKEAKRWLKGLREKRPDARTRFERAYPNGPATPVLRDVQHALAREYGQDSWVALQRELEARGERAALQAPETTEAFDRLAADLLLAFNARDTDALQRLNDYYRRAFTFEDLRAEIWRRLYSFRQRAFSNPEESIQPGEAQLVIAQNAGFSSWAALIEMPDTRRPPVPPYAVDATDSRITPCRHLNESEWDALLGAMREHRLSRLEASTVTDSILARIAQLDHVTSLSLSGSRSLTDAGILLLAGMPQLKHLNLTDTNATDRGLEVLRQLPNLETFEMTWHRGITDAGVAQLKWCDRLERVDVMGTFTGDGVIEALQDKPDLRTFSSGRLVTDAGVRLLQNFPRFKTWQGNGPRDAGEPDADSTRLLIDGPVTDEGLSTLAMLDGVFALDLFWHVTGVTPDGFAHLVHMPNLGSLGADGSLTNDDVFGHLARMPRLRRLRAQGTHATDDGFVALSRSRSLEGLWCGKDETALGRRGIAALSAMPALRSLGVNCHKVDDAGLSALPRFAALTALTPIGFTDAGFRHVGKCERLEDLSCMYCRETTDAATEHVAALRLRKYYAGLTQITDRSLEVLGGMPSLEDVEFYECLAVTDAGLAFLAALPSLQKISVTGLPHVTFEGTRAFSARVRVSYST
jgi:hypothetical protein